MQYILSLLPLLACPVGMGLLMWFMMRSQKVQSPGEADPARLDSAGETPVAEILPGNTESPKSNAWLSMFAMCLNWKVVTGLAVIGLLVFVVDSHVGLVLLPILLVAACPLSMLFMMRGMRGGTGQSPSQPASACCSSTMEPTRTEQLTTLRSHLLSVQREQEALANRITQLEREDGAVFSSLEAGTKTDSAIHAERRGPLPKW